MEILYYITADRVERGILHLMTAAWTTFIERIQVKLYKQREKVNASMKRLKFLLSEFSKRKTKRLIQHPVHSHTT